MGTATPTSVCYIHVWLLQSREYPPTLWVPGIMMSELELSIFSSMRVNISGGFYRHLALVSMAPHSTAQGSGTEWSGMSTRRSTPAAVFICPAYVLLTTVKWQFFNNLCCVCASV